MLINSPGRTASLRECVASNLKIVRHSTVIAQGNRRERRGLFGSGKSAQLFENLPIETRLLKRGRITRRQQMQIDCQNQDALRRGSLYHSHETAKAFHLETCAHHESERQRHLRDHEGAAQPLLCKSRRRTSATFLERFIQAR